MVAIVNGYVCFSTCDAKAAQQGRDPNAPPGSPPRTGARKPGDPPTGFDAQPATVFGGALGDLPAATAVTPARGANAAPRPLVDRTA
jgi:hypothetical protein